MNKPTTTDENIEVEFLTEFDKENIRLIIRDELNGMYDFVRTSIESGSMDISQPSGTKPYSGEAERTGSISDLKNERLHGARVPKLSNVVIAKLYDENTLSDSISQKGIIEDETGRIVFTVFNKSKLPALVEGKRYNLTTMYTNIWEDTFSLNMCSTTGIEELTPVEWEHDTSRTGLDFI